MSVNVSALQFDDPTFVDTVLEVIAGHELNASRLVLELTESLLLTDTPQFHNVLGRLRSHGIRLSIDDFGTGYSSLSYLAQYPLDFLKIDRRFVADLPRQAPMVEAIIAMAHALDLTVIAEGVETQAQLGHLRDFGCDYVQGFLLAMPVPVGALMDTCELSSTPAT